MEGGAGKGYPLIQRPLFLLPASSIRPLGQPDRFSPGACGRAAPARYQHINSRVSLARAFFSMRDT